MVQLYLLSIFCNGLIGLLIIFGEFVENSTIEGSMKSSLFGGGFRLAFGIVAAAIGILKLLSPFEGMYILGDLIPALAGIVSGFILIFAFYREHSVKVDDEGKLDRFGEFFLRNKKVSGIVLLAIAILHFLAPRALFL
jgi:hypothetical protein